MKVEYFSEQDIEKLKANITEIIIDSSKDGAGFTITLVMKDGQYQTLPGSMSLSEAVGCSGELGKLIGLPETHIKASAESIERNRLNDLDAMRTSKAIKAGVIRVFKLN